MRNARAGQVQFRADKAGIVQCTIGRAPRSRPATARQPCGAGGGGQQVEARRHQGDFSGRSFRCQDPMGVGVKVSPRRSRHSNDFGSCRQRPVGVRSEAAQELNSRCPTQTAFLIQVRRITEGGRPWVLVWSRSRRWSRKSRPGCRALQVVLVADTRPGRREGHAAAVEGEKVGLYLRVLRRPWRAGR